MLSVPTTLKWPVLTVQVQVQVLIVWLFFSTSCHCLIVQVQILIVWLFKSKLWLSDRTSPSCDYDWTSPSSDCMFKLWLHNCIRPITSGSDNTEVHTEYIQDLDFQRHMSWSFLCSMVWGERWLLVLVIFVLFIHSFHSK